jgi:hypothetical protein
MKMRPGRSSGIVSSYSRNWITRRANIGCFILIWNRDKRLLMDSHLKNENALKEGDLQFFQCTFEIAESMRREL